VKRFRAEPSELFQATARHAFFDPSTKSPLLVMADTSGKRNFCRYFFFFFPTSPIPVRVGSPPLILDFSPPFFGAFEHARRRASFSDLFHETLLTSPVLQVSPSIRSSGVFRPSATALAPENANDSTLVLRRDKRAPFFAVPPDFEEEKTPINCLLQPLSYPGVFPPLNQVFPLPFSTQAFFGNGIIEYFAPRGG